MVRVVLLDYNFRKHRFTNPHLKFNHASASKQINKYNSSHRRSSGKIPNRLKFNEGYNINGFFGSFHHVLQYVKMFPYLWIWNGKRKSSGFTHKNRRWWEKSGILRWMCSSEIVCRRKNKREIHVSDIRSNWIWVVSIDGVRNKTPYTASNNFTNRCRLLRTYLTFYIIYVFVFKFYIYTLYG